MPSPAGVSDRSARWPSTEPCSRPNTMCVNPDHLQPVTYRDNIAEMLARSSYISRIAELEKALADISPEHPILKRIPLAS